MSLPTMWNLSGMTTSMVISCVPVVPPVVVILARRDLTAPHVLKMLVSEAPGLAGVGTAVAVAVGIGEGVAGGSGVFVGMGMSVGGTLVGVGDAPHALTAIAISTSPTSISFFKESSYLGTRFRPHVIGPSHTTAAIHHYTPLIL